MKKNNLTEITRNRLLQEEVLACAIGSPLPSEKELSTKYQVSVTTLRRAVDYLENSGYVKRRQGSGTYVMTHSGKRRIGILVPETEYTEFSRVIAHKLIKAMNDIGYENTLFLSSGYDFDVNAIKKSLKTLDALVFCNIVPTKAQLASFNIPCLCVGIEGTADVPFISFDLCTAIRQQVFHLLDNGYRNIVFLTHHNSQLALDNSLRYYAFRLALEERGIRFNHGMIQACGLTFQGWQKKVQELLEKYQDVDAVICSNDEMAISVISLLKNAGKRIPEDIGVVGCNNIMASERQEIPLTTIDFNLDLLAQETIHFLSSRIFDGKASDVLVNSVLPLRLVVRRSSSGKEMESEGKAKA